MFFTLSKIKLQSNSKLKINQMINTEKKTENTIKIIYSNKI